MARTKAKRSKAKRPKAKRSKAKRSKDTTKGKNKKVKTKMNSKQFNKYLLSKEKEYWKEMQDCHKPCSRIKTNYTKNKKQFEKQQQCFKKCEDERLKKIRSIHKKYPKEFKQYIKEL